MAVTPVFTESPMRTVAWPTRTPGTSVMASSGPDGSVPTTIPSAGSAELLLRVRGRHEHQPEDERCRGERAPHLFPSRQAFTASMNAFRSAISASVRDSA